MITQLGSRTQVAASVLDTLLAASGSPDSGFQVAAVVTQPPAAKNRGRKLMPSAVAQLALDRGFPEELIFTPEKAREVTFLVTNLESGSCTPVRLWKYGGAELIVISDAMQESFLSDLKEVKPDVCITAAYGNILPQKFLDIPPCGTSGCPSTCFVFPSSSV